ncbi:MAG: ribonuclease P protein component, partial [bacterium]|nr:ribonuclease P protein component [bacterium]
FFFYFLKNDHGYHRFAISVNRKIGNAVQRNFIKRKMKEFFRLNRHLLKKDHDLWIVTKACFDRSNAAEAEELFLQSLKRMNNFKNFKTK